MHGQVHQPQTLYCYSQYCNAAFKTLSGMIVHFESGTCPSGITDGDLGDLLDTYLFSKEFMNSDYYSYFFPDSQGQFDMLSALCQHIEDTRPCSYLLDYPQCIALLDRHVQEDIPYGQWR